MTHKSTLWRSYGINDISAYQREQLAATYTSLLLRFLILRQKVEAESLKSSEVTLEEFMARSKVEAESLKSSEVTLEEWMSSSKELD